MRQYMHTLRKRMATLNHTSVHSRMTDYIYTREFINFDDFRKHMEWGVSDYNTKRPYSLLNYMTPEEFESAILNEDFKKKLGGTNMMNYLNEHGKLSEES